MLEKEFDLDLKLLNYSLAGKYTPYTYTYLFGPVQIYLFVEF